MNASPVLAPIILPILVFVLLLRRHRRRRASQIGVFRQLQRRFQIPLLFHSKRHRLLGLSILLRGQLQGKVFEVLHQDFCQRGQFIHRTSISLLEPFLEAAGDLILEIRRKTFLANLMAILRNRRPSVGDRAIDGRVLYYCNDFQIGRALLHFDETHRSLREVCKGFRRRTQLRVRNGRLEYYEHRPVGNEADGRRLGKMLLFMNDLADLILARGWLHFGTQSKKHFQPIEKDQESQSTDVEAHQSTGDF